MKRSCNLGAIKKKCPIGCARGRGRPAGRAPGRGAGHAPARSGIWRNLFFKNHKIRAHAFYPVPVYPALCQERCPAYIHQFDASWQYRRRGEQDPFLGLRFSMFCVLFKKHIRAGTDCASRVLEYVDASSLNYCATCAQPAQSLPTWDRLDSKGCDNPIYMSCTLLKRQHDIKSMTFIHKTS